MDYVKHSFLKNSVIYRDLVAYSKELLPYYSKSMRKQWIRQTAELLRRGDHALQTGKLMRSGKK